MLLWWAVCVAVGGGRVIGSSIVVETGADACKATAGAPYSCVQQCQPVVPAGSTAESWLLLMRLYCVVRSLQFYERVIENGMMAGILWLDREEAAELTCSAVICLKTVGTGHRFHQKT